MMQLSLLRLMAIGVGVLACNNPVEGGGPSTVTAVVAPPAVTAPGSQFPDLELRFTDHESRPIVGTRLTLSGDGTVNPAEVTTDADGRVRFAWTLPGIGILGDSERLGPPGAFRVRARSLDGELTWEATTEARVFRASQVDATLKYACAVRDAELWCWGVPGQQISGSPTLLRTPVRATLPAGFQVAEVRVNSYAACIRRLEDGIPWCAKVTSDPGSFVAIANAPALLDLIDLGAEFCGRAADRTLWCWPTDDFSSVAASQRSTVQFTTLSGTAIQFLSIKPDGYACGIDDDGVAWCWGNNVLGGLGDGTTTSRSTPAPVLSDQRFVSLLTGTAGACARTVAGATWCWGEEVLGELTTVPTLFDLPGSAGRLIQPGFNMVYGLGPDGIATWFNGAPADFQPSLNEVFRAVAIADEMREGCALGALGEVYCSWTMLRGISVTTVFTSQFIPVPGI